jgi:tetratricopeptide (TPR) repeat protein
MSVMTTNSGAVMGSTLYEVLGVPETATPEEIKRAYFRLVRRHRPTERPEMFQQFNNAHRVLSDERRRGAYDQARKAGRRVQALQDQAAAALDKDTQKAIMLLRSAIAFAPDLPRPRMMLAQALTRIAEYEAAEKQFLWLIEDDPRNESLRVKFARSLLLQQRYTDAEEQLHEALRINPLYYDAMVTLSRVYDAAERVDEAVATLEQAIGSHGADNFADLDALMRLLVLHFQRGRVTDMETTKQRVLAVLPTDDPDRLGRGIRRIARRGRELYESGKDSAATVLAELAVAGAAFSDEIDETVKAEAEFVFKVTFLSLQARRIVEDPLVEGALRECIRLKYLDRSSEEARKSRMDGLLAALQTEIVDDPKRLSAAIDYLRREYPEVSADQNAFLQELVARIVRRLQILGPEGKYASKAGMDGPTAMPGTPGGRKGLFGWLRVGK